MTTQRTPFHFDVWGCRGSRSYLPPASRIGNSTSCYSLLAGELLVVFDAGRGLAALGAAMETEARFATVRRVEVFISHAHLDHWEGLKDVAWFWRRNNGLTVTLSATAEALRAIEDGHAHPSYVALDVLASGTVSSLTFNPMGAGDVRSGDGFSVDAFPLNHASGHGESRRALQTLGYRLAVADGPTVAYLLDHEPTPETYETEKAVLTGAQLAVYDAHFANVRDQLYGHGSQEHAARMAREHAGLLVLAGHHGPMYTDEALRATFRHHGRGRPGYQLAIEGRGYVWDGTVRRFRSRRAPRREPVAAS